MNPFLSHLTSKTNVGLYMIILFATALVMTHNLTAEAVDLIKWVGGSFFLVRGVANFQGPTPPQGPST